MKIGILGAARIAPWAIIQPARRSDAVEIAAVAAARSGAAEKYAGDHDIPKAYDNYDALISDPTIDLIYNALPPKWHAELCIKALESGKHVLCEKPFAMNVDEAQTMNDAAARTGKRIIEAFHDRYHPVYRYALSLKDTGRLGEIESLEAVFNHSVPYVEGEFRHRPESGGGVLMDMGCYPVHWCRNFVDEEPIVESATAKLTDRGVDEEITATLGFPSGIRAKVESRMSPGWEYHAIFVVRGTRGSLTLKNSILAHMGHSIIEDIDGVVKEFTLAGNTTFDHQLEAVVNALATGEALPTEGQDPIGNLSTISAIFKAAGITDRG